jgi:hypothetical protein
LHWGLKSLAVVAAAGALGVAGTESFRMSSATPATLHWQGPFHYEAQFATHAAGCSVDGSERIDGVVTCTGQDLTGLKCTAEGRADRKYRVASSGASTIEREDAGSYTGRLTVDYRSRRRTSGEMFTLSVAADVPLHYQQTSDGMTRTGAYTLQVGGTTEQQLYQPDSQQLDFHQTQTINEPGPAGCASSAFNGTSSVAVRLAPR